MSRIPKEEQNDYWNNYAKRHLLDKVIAHTRYMTEDEANAIDWTTRPLALIMEDGSYIFPSMDDEGNDGGAFAGEFVENELVGKKITFVGYMTEEESRNTRYNHRPIIMLLDDGGWIYPCRDGERNDGGAMFGTSANGEELTFPVI
tara:strand:- start:2572 stop:3009 length:438 start_codon:yes stop_codon:yes gene_type:complete